MAMSVMHNSGAALALGELNKNVNKVGKLLGKVSSGQKINSAQDDSSGYAISEKMREQIRSLLQGEQNVQNGSSLLKTAESGISNIVDELRTLKELALNAANDHNTDLDRKTIQKEFNQRMANINDIATETNYNGKPLLDGNYHNKIVSWIDPDVTVLENTNAMNICSSFYAVGGTTTLGGGTNNELNISLPVYPRFGYNARFEKQVGIDFSGMTFKEGTLPFALDKQGFSILCGGCEQFINIRFDASIPPAASRYNPDVAKGMTQLNSKAQEFSTEFTIGVLGVTDINELPEAIFQGIFSLRDEVSLTSHPDFSPRETSAPSTPDSAVVNARHNFRIEKNPTDPTKYIFSTTGGGTSMDFFEGIINNPVITERKMNALKIQHGTQANQNINFYINDMHTKSLKGVIPNDSDSGILRALNHDTERQKEYSQTLQEAKDKTLDDVKVTTKHDANVAVRVIEGAIEYALDESTRLGSYIQRLEFTNSNITTMNENVQAAESTIRDADMAKEMTEYTKNNILVQSSQAMLAQANQNSSQILSLLQ